MGIESTKARAIFIAIILWFAARNFLMPLAFDDYCYAFVWTGAGNLVDNAALDNRIDSLAEIVDSQINHYFVWGGRTIAHCIVQFFMSIDKIYFDIANTAIFAALIFLIAKLADVRLSTKNLLWIVFGLWLAVPQFMYGMLWLTGACNYLWMSVLQLLFIYLMQQPLAPSNYALRITHYALSFLAGWSNEAGAGVSILLAVYFTLPDRNRKPRRLIGIAFALLGLAIMVLAPGNFERMHHLHPDGFRLTTNILLEHFETLLQIIGREAFLFLPIVFAPKKFRSIAPFIVAALLIPTVMMISPVFKDYAGFASPIFLLIASTAALDAIELPKLAKPIAVVISIGMLASLFADWQHEFQLKEQFRLIESQRGAETIELPPMNFDPTLDAILGDRVLNHYVGAEFGSHIWGLNQNPNAYYNRAVANYYGLKNIVAEEPN